MADRRRLDLVLPDGRVERIQIGPSLAEGAAGTIHRDLINPRRVVKLYKDPRDRQRQLPKLQAMLRNPPVLPRITGAPPGLEQIAWPLGLVQEPGSGSEMLGFAMPYVDMDLTHNLERLLTRSARSQHKLPEAWAARLYAAANLAALMASLHRVGHHVIDLKPINLRVAIPSMLVTLVDCDGFSIQGSGSERFPAQQYSEDYVAPEVGRQPPEALGEAQDRFAMAVILFRLLNNGLHPYQGVPVDPDRVPSTIQGRIDRGLYAYGPKANPLQTPSPSSLYPWLLDQTQDLFDAAFTAQPEARPRAEDWAAHLALLLKPGVIQRCARDPQHAHFVKGCGLCALDGLRAQALAGAAAAAASGSRHRSLQAGAQAQTPARRGAALRMPARLRRNPWAAAQPPAALTRPTARATGPVVVQTLPPAPAQPSSLERWGDLVSGVWRLLVLALGGIANLVGLTSAASILLFLFYILGQMLATGGF